MEVETESHSLQILTERTWLLHGKINEKINENGFAGFCNNCSNHGRHCVVAENITWKERETMIAIKDSLKDVHNNLTYLKSLKSSQKRDRDEALSLLEESRMLLIERINQCTGKERKLGVLEELIKFLGDEKKNEFPMNFKGEIVDEEKKLNGFSSFLVKTRRFALEFVVIFASIYSTAKFYEKRQRQRQRQGQGQHKPPPVERETIALLIVDDSKAHLDVLCGRG